MRMFCCIALLLSSFLSYSTEPMTVYLIPGQGGDARLFTHFRLEGNHIIKYIDYQLPEKGMSMRDYAEILTRQIDTSEPFVIVGVSLGGMIATEMSELVDAEQVIVISSAKNWYELPGRYRCQRKLPIYKLVTPGMAVFGAKVLQPIVEPDRQSQKDIFKAMLRDKDGRFITRTIPMMIEWERTESPSSIYHIHGSNDHTIPISNVSCDHRIEGASHMMVLTDAQRVSAAVNELLAEISSPKS